MSCYNASRWLGEAIESVLSQTFKDFEFIIVDDGSNDETLNILQMYAARDARIVIISKLNTGLGDSLNVGIRNARGEWIARLDADDICEPTRLEKQIQLAESNTPLVFIGTGLTIIDEHGARLAIHRYPTRHDALVRHLRQVRKFPPHSSAMYRTAAVRAIEGYRTRIRRAQDYDLWLRLSRIGKLACINEPLVRIRKHANQISHEDSGRRQKIDSRVALTSYFIRLSGAVVDPVSDDETHFYAFRDWIEKRLGEGGFYAVEQIQRQVRGLPHAPSRVAATLNMFDMCFKYLPVSLRLIQRRFTGENLAQGMAQEWVKISINNLEL